MVVVLYCINLSELKSPLPAWFLVRVGQGNFCAIFKSWQKRSGHVLWGAVLTSGAAATLHVAVHLLTCWDDGPAGPTAARVWPGVLFFSSCVPAVCAVYGRGPASAGHPRCRGWRSWGTNTGSHLSSFSCFMSTFYMLMTGLPIDSDLRPPNMQR